MATRTFNSPSFAAMSAMLVEANSRRMDVVFATATPSAEVKKSKATLIMSIHYNDTTREIRAVGADGNVRVCKVDRLQSIEHGRTLWKILVGAKNEGTPIQFMAAGGFNPDRWFYDIAHAE